MTQRLAQWITCMMLALVSCSEVHRPTVEDSQTHWLHSCQSRHSCGAGMDCVCGRCVVTCQDQVCSIADRQTRCVEPHADSVQSLCGAEASRVSICLESCAEGRSCPDEQQCVAGACVPKRSAGCELAGVHYEPGAAVPSGDCNACTCEDGGLRCTTIACAPAMPEPAELPMKDGIPTGDCREPTAAELAAQGCPATEPAPLSSCDVVGKVCRYALRLDSSLALQPVFVCTTQKYWGSGSLELCGKSCAAMSGGQTIELASAACSGRSLAVCNDGQGTVYSYPPSGYRLADSMLKKALAACGADFADNPVELAFENGCPARLASQRAFEESVVACLRAQLESQRWECASQLPCVFRLWGPT